MLNSERIFKIRVRLDYLHLKSFAWKRDCLISSKLQTSRISPKPF